MNRKSAVLLIAAALVFAAAAAAGAQARPGEITLMTWGGDFVPRAIIEEFEKETGVKVHYKEVTSNEDMQSLLEANPDQYDLIICTDYMVDILRQNGMLEVLDKSQMPNYSNINPVYLNKYYDPESEYAIPYAISISLLLVNQEEVERLGAKPITTYSDLWQPELRSKVVVVDWSVEIMGIVLKSLGYEYNETDPAKVAEAREKLFALKPNIVRFETNTPEDSLINGEAVAGFMYSNQAVKGNAADPRLQPVFPTEGMPIFMDCWVMSKAAPNKEGAYQFLDFIMRPEIAAEIADITKFTTPNKAAEPFLPEDYRNNPMLNLPDEVVENTSFYIGVDKVLVEYEHIYTEFKLR